MNKPKQHYKSLNENILYKTFNYGIITLVLLCQSLATNAKGKFPTCVIQTHCHNSVVDTPLALSIKIIDTPAKGCNRRLYAGPPSLGCPNLTYEWKDATGAIVSTSRTLDITAIDTTFYVVSVNDGCNTAKDTIHIFPCDCSPVKVLGKPYTTLVSGAVPASLPAGNYYVPSSIVLSGNTDFNSVIMLIEPNVQITVPNASKLSIDNAHLFTCPDTNKLWKGIKLDNGTATTGRIEVKNNSLIEDAEIAINAINPNNPSTDKIIDIENAVFNRNIIGINIEHCTLTKDSIYPFSIINTLFTSRQLNTSGSGYPYTWTAAKALKAYTPNGTHAPYYLDLNYLKVRAKNDKPLIAGIKLNHVGNVIGTQYYEIEIGGGLDTSDANLFDNTSTGIYAENSNLSCYNNIFTHMQALTAFIDTIPSLSYRGCGIYANALGSSPSRLRAAQAPLVNSNAINKFFDCGKAIQSMDYYENYFQSNRITSSNTDTTGYANMGIYCVTASPCKNFKVDNNNISNVTIGISVLAANTSLSENSSISNNILAAINPWLPLGVSTAGQSLQQGIYFDGARAGGSSPVWMDNNTIEAANNGIEATNVKGHKLRIAYNDINHLRALTSTKAQYGIAIRNTYGALVSQNNINMTSLATSNKIRAVYAAFNTNLQVCSNTSSNMDRAFEFAQVRPQVGTRWIMNTMYNSNKGFILGSDIGAQGFTFRSYLMPPYTYDGAGNQWIGFGEMGKSETFVENNRNTKHSILHVRDGVTPNELPTFNGSIYVSSTYPYIYDLAGSLITKTSLSNCDGHILPTRYSSLSSSAAIKPLGMLVVSDSLAYEDKLSQWMAQLSVFESGIKDTIQMDSFAIFNRFMQHAASSRFKWITDVQTALYNMDTNLVDTLLSISPQAAGRQVIDSDVILTDYQEADTLIKNYNSYYTAYLQYLKKQTIDTNELERLAAKCPAKDGAAVYLARSLYALISGLYTSYDDDNCMNAHGQLRFTKLTSNEQDQKTYSLYPNEGSFVIQNASLTNIAQDDKTIMIRVYNAVGAMVYGMNTGFRYGKINVAMGQKPAGTYIVCIFDGSEKATCLPFVIK